MNERNILNITVNTVTGMGCYRSPQNTHLTQASIRKGFSLLPTFAPPSGAFSEPHLRSSYLGITKYQSGEMCPLKHYIKMVQRNLRRSKRIIKPMLP